MADVPVPSIVTATPAAADTVLGVQGGAVKRFSLSALPFIQDGAGATAQTVQAALRGMETTLEAYGGVAGGVADCASALELAVNAGKTVRIPAGMTYKIGTAKTLDQPVRLVGGGRLLFTTTGQTALTCSGTVYLEDVNLDGNNVSNELIRATGARFEMVGGEVKNVFQSAPSDGVSAIRAIGCTYLRIAGVAFSGIAGAENGIEGDALGAVSGVYIGGACGYGVVEDCTFDNINNRATAGGPLEYEDADAIRTQTTSGIQNITVRRNKFSNIGKRAAKFLGVAGCRYRFDNNEITSSYSATADNSAALGNGMFSVVSCHGGKFAADGNTLDAGVCGFFFDGGGAALESVRLDGNTFVPEYHKYVNTSLTRFAFINSGVAAPLIVSCRGNRIANTYYGAVSYSKSNSFVDNPLVETVGQSFVAEAGGSLIVTGNMITQSALGSATTETAHGVLAKNGLTRAVINGNVFAGKYDGINIANQSAAFRASVVGNAFDGTARNDLTITNGQQQYVTQFANISSAASPQSFIQSGTQATVGAAGAAAALPATPTGYLRTFINGTEYAVPYYARA